MAAKRVAAPTAAEGVEIATVRDDPDFVQFVPEIEFGHLPQSPAVEAEPVKES